jgi:hypothetical protein
LNTDRNSDSGSPSLPQFWSESLISFFYFQDTESRKNFRFSGCPKILTTLEEHHQTQHHLQKYSHRNHPRTSQYSTQYTRQVAKYNEINSEEKKKKIIMFWYSFKVQVECLFFSSRTTWNCRSTEKKLNNINNEVGDHWSKWGRN